MRMRTETTVSSFERSLPGRPGPVTVWLLDDCESVRELMAELVSADRGFQVRRQFSSSRSLLAALSAGPGPDILLMDVNLAEEESGLESIRPVLELSPETRVIMVSTFYDSLAERRALNEGASGFLLKVDLAYGAGYMIHEALTTPRPVPEPEPSPGKRGLKSERFAMLRHLFSHRKTVAQGCT